MFVFNVVLILLWPLMPESAYWLLSHKNDPEAARKSLRILHGPGKDDFIAAEILRLQRNIEASNAIWHLEKGKPKLSEAFKGQHLKRTTAAFLAAASQMFCGVIFVVGYIPYFLTLAGIPNPFNWNMYLFTVNLLANLASFWTVEQFGRRNIIVYGLGLMALVNICIGGLNVGPNTPKLYATIALTYVWAALYQMSIGALGFTFASEVGSLPLRQVTQSIITMSNAFWAWVFVFTIPYMISESIPSSKSTRCSFSNWCNLRSGRRKSGRDGGFHLRRPGSGYFHPWYGPFLHAFARLSLTLCSVFPLPRD